MFVAAHFTSLYPFNNLCWVVKIESTVECSTSTSQLKTQPPTMSSQNANHNPKTTAPNALLLGETIVWWVEIWAKIHNVKLIATKDLISCNLQQVIIIEVTYFEILHPTSAAQTIYLLDTSFLMSTCCGRCCTKDFVITIFHHTSSTKTEKKTFLRLHNSNVR